MGARHRAKRFRREISAGAVIFYENRGREYLLLQYQSRAPKLGARQAKAPTGVGARQVTREYWGFPKGQVEREHKESLEDAAFREIREETGLARDELELVPGFREKIHYFFREEDTLVSKDVVYFLIRSRTKRVMLSKEHVAFDWLPYAMARGRITHKNHRELLEKVERFLNQHATD